MIKFLTKVRRDKVTYLAEQVETLDKETEEDLVKTSVAVYHVPACKDGVCEVKESKKDEKPKVVDNEPEINAESTDDDQETESVSIDDVVGEFDASEYDQPKKSGKKSRK